MTESLSDKYTSLLGMVDADSSDSFIHFLERVVARLKGWNENLLAIGGGILLKAVIRSILVFTMGVFKTP